MSTPRYQGVDPVLTDISLGYQNAEYIAPLLLPTVPVAEQSGKHFVYDKGRFRTIDSRRGPGARSKEVSHNLTTGLTFYCEDHAAKQFVTDDEIRNAQATGLDPEADATENVTEMLLIEREMEAAALLTNSSVITQYTALSGTSQWNDANSDPIAAIKAAKQVIRASIMQFPNTLVLSQTVYDTLVDHPGLLERFKYAEGGILNQDHLKRAFGIQNIIIGAAQKNGSVEGQADSMSDIWGKNALLAYISPKKGQKIVTLGVTYQWKQKQVEHLRGSDEEDRKGHYIRVGEDYRDAELVAAGAGYLFQTAVA